MGDKKTVYTGRYIKEKILFFRDMVEIHRNLNISD